MISATPIKVPLVLGVSPKRFSARIQIKFKPFFASISYCLTNLGNRIWVGLQDDLPLELELAIDPIISNKSVQLDLVNRLIQHRIKALIRDQLMLPKMQISHFG